MTPIDQLPIPDWGLQCPQCGAPLAGAPTHQCSTCGEVIDIRELLAQKHPIPDLGLECPNCGYNLTGLMENRCPECGVAFRLLPLLGEPQAGSAAIAHCADPPDCHIPRKTPTFTGHERPLPDFGLICPHCDRPLAGATDDRCPGCGEAFDVTNLVGRGDWVLLSDYVPDSVDLDLRATLYDNQVPYLVDNAALMVIYGDRPPFAGGGIRIPRDYFFDALHAIEQATQPPPDYASKPWKCPSCGEKVPTGFEVCWNCGREHPIADSADSIGEEEP